METTWRVAAGTATLRRFAADAPIGDGRPAQRGDLGRAGSAEGRSQCSGGLGNRGSATGGGRYFGGSHGSRRGDHAQEFHLGRVADGGDRGATVDIIRRAPSGTGRVATCADKSRTAQRGADRVAASGARCRTIGEGY